MDRYKVRLPYRPDDGCCVVQTVEFVGCAVDGPTPEIALARLRDAKAEWINSVQANGHSVPIPRSAKEANASEADRFALKA